MNGMMSGMGTAMSGMGIVWLLGLVALVLVVAAAVKYLFFDKRRKD